MDRNPHVIAPLLHEGIDTFKISYKGRESPKVAQDEAQYFIARPSTKARP